MHQWEYWNDGSNYKSEHIFLKSNTFLHKEKTNAVFNKKNENKVYQTMFHKSSVNI